MLINLTNHPSEQWSEKQKRAAQVLFGGVVDYPFPDVDPEAETEEVWELAGRIVEDVLGRWSGQRITVLVQGEFTLTVALVYMFERAGVECVCATARRQVEDLGGGRTLRRFEFCGFRRYGLRRLMERGGGPDRQ